MDITIGRVQDRPLQLFNHYRHIGLVATGINQNHHAISCRAGAALEADPAHIFGPGVAVKFTRNGVDGHAAMSGVEVDPADVCAPGEAGQCAVSRPVDAIVGRAAVGMGAGGAIARAQPDPAHILGPGIPFQVVVIDGDGAVGGAEVDPAAVGAPGPFVDRVNAAAGVAQTSPGQANDGDGKDRSSQFLSHLASS